MVVITHDRPAYLSRTVTSVLDHMTNPAKFPVYISQVRAPPGLPIMARAAGAVAVHAAQSGAEDYLA